MTTNADTDLWGSFLALAEEEGLSSGGDALEGASLPWPEWFARFYGDELTAPFAERHIHMWDWFEQLEPGVMVDPFLALWPRGGGKSTNVELCVARLCARLTRHYVLYLCGTQDQANEHVGNIAGYLENLNVGRAINKYGRALGWRGDLLRTDNGFNVAAYGFDTSLRGSRLGNYRPDVIVLDDIDALHDTPDAVAKKIRTLTSSILPAGSTDCAVIVAQNPMRIGSIVYQLWKGQADFLRGAIVDGPIPAVEGLEIDDDPANPAKLRIVAGTPTWEGQGLDVCEFQINKWGPQAFLRESQHDMRAGGAFFPEYEPTVHVIATPDIDDVDNYPKPWWTWFGGFDGGYNDPAAFSLWCVSPVGQVQCVEAWEVRFMRPPEQAQLAKESITRWGLDLNRVAITYDHTMNATKWKGVDAEADVQAFSDAGLVMLPSDPDIDRKPHGWNRLRTLLALRLPGGGAGLVMYRETAIRMADAIGAARFHLTKPEDMAHDATSHLNHSGMYSVAGHFDRPVDPHAPKPKPPDQYILASDEYRKKQGKDSWTL